MIDAIINQGVVDGLMTRLSDIGSISNFSQYSKTIMELFDGEDALANAARILSDETLSAIDTSNMDNSIMQAEIARAINKAVLIGFLCERFARDQLMDSKSKHDNKQVVRGYEGLEDFINRRIKNTDMKVIAKNEAGKEGQW